MANLDDTAPPPSHLISAHHVRGATVYNTELETLGTVEDLMIDKASGRIAYAVLSFGGFLGIHHHHYPIPWEKLSYNDEMGGYIADIDQATLKGAPSYAKETAASWHDKAWGRKVYAHYGADPFWDLGP